jgi:predicted dehydrogenase
MKSFSQRRIGRRPFIGAALGAAGTLASLRHAGGAFVAGSDVIRVGLVGCGGRGTGAALQATAADRGTVVTALGDLFADQVQSAAELLAANGRIDCPADRRFSGPDAWLRVIHSDIDALILAAPPWLRPDHVAAAVRAGRHVFCEKPAAVDAAGVARVLAACSEARQYGLSFVSGLCPRRHQPTMETVARIRAGGVGRPLRAAVHARLGLPWRRPVQPDWTALEGDVRNWISCERFSGGHFVAHHIDAIDRAIWALGDDWPVAAVPLQAGADFAGTAVRFLYDDGRFIDASIDRREGGTCWIEERLTGSTGLADLRRHAVAGWRHGGDAPNPYQACASAFIASLRDGRPADDGDTLCRSTLAAVMGRAASVAGRRVDWRDLEAAAGIQGRYDRYNAAERDPLAAFPPITSMGCAPPA